ncbi:NUDIX domain-containing protein [Actinoplanes sp. GCM10030250]|uniref:NUDIX domain-containing protein n=1 Tax=Actinoplanes sp. GCM10030250 TaxID=3273376 RepID=UPI00361F3F4B
MDNGVPQVAWAGRHFQVLLTPVTYPDGTVKTHEQVQAPDVVRVYGVADDAVLLIREYRADVGRRVYRVPSGRVEAGESAEAAARREFREEAGREALGWELLKAARPVLKFKYTVWHFLATDLSFVGQDTEPGEDIEVVRMPLDQVPDMVLDGFVEEDSIAMTLLRIARRFGKRIPA